MGTEKKIADRENVIASPVNPHTHRRAWEYYHEWPSTFEHDGVEGDRRFQARSTLESSMGSALPQVVFGPQHPAAPSGTSSEAEFSADVVSRLSAVMTMLASRPDCRISAYLQPLQSVVEAIRETASTASPQAAMAAKTRDMSSDQR